MGNVSKIVIKINSDCRNVLLHQLISSIYIMIHLYIDHNTHIFCGRLEAQGLNLWSSAVVRVSGHLP